jgi:hypothetical protein
MSPKNLLLLDGLGALLTSLATGLLLATSLIPTGLPAWILWVLSIVAAGFACFDLAAYRLVNSAGWPLAVIGLLNLSYCITAISICAMHWAVMTGLGKAYFVAESAIVIPLAIVELLVASRCLSQERKAASKL